MRCLPFITAMRKFWEYLRDIWEVIYENFVSEMWGVVLSALAMGVILFISSVLVEC